VASNLTDGILNDATSDPPIPPNFRPGAFAGVADDYVRYRLPYPPAMIAEMLTHVAVPREGAKAIDLACGTGRVALAIVHRFEAIWAVDPEPEMLAAGRHEALCQGAGAIDWRLDRAESLEAPDCGFDLVTVGDAFHRLDRPRVAALAFGWLAPGGAMVTLGTEGFLDGSAAWRQSLKDVVRTHVGEPARRLGAPTAGLAQEIADQEEVLRAAGFDPVFTRNFGLDHTWRLDDLLGNLRSTSVLSPTALGDRHAGFEAEVRAALLKFDPSGRYAETVRFGYTVARKATGPFQPVRR